MGLLREEARRFGLHLTSEHLRAFEAYCQELDLWNRKFNLTTVTHCEDVQIKHFLDSLTCLLALPAPGRSTSDPLPDVVPLSSRDEALLCIDVGSGAGFPGLPVKILRPALHMTLLESVRKKVGFLRHMVDHLALTRVEPVWARAEDAGQDPHHRERYDVVLARAVADLTVLAEFCLPLCRKGGCWIAQKGAEIETELGQAQPAIELLGGRIREVKSLQLPGMRELRSLVVIDKVSPTPSRFPRRPGIPKKQPIMTA
jgi:16S rRNA (guanine527-N7)-methyltransferase